MDKQKKTYSSTRTWKNETTKKREEKKKKKRGKHTKKMSVTKNKESKELREDSPTNNFLVGNHGPRRAERWEDTPSMSSEVGEI